MRKLKTAAVILIFVAIVSIAVPSPALADGGLIIPYDLWADLEEGQQIAVVTILNQDYARVDLFISIQDTTSESHEIVFFVPIGAKTSGFNAVEQNLFTFDEQATKGLDKILRDNATDRQHAVQALFAGALLTNGAFLVPLWAPVLLTGCGVAEQKPEATLQTESSEISIYGIDDNTDLTALIQTTGLPPSVSNTLAKLKGQQIAVVRLQTKPQGQAETETENNRPWQQSTEPGLHLSWQTSLLPAAGGTAYSYPLGTGAAWSKPIELTRVYIVAPKGMDFNVRYPAIGEEKSGYDIIEGSYISKYYETSSYAVDKARGSYGRVWRVTYTQSNPTEDITITVKPQSGLSRFFTGAEESALPLSVLFALVIGLVVWVLAWRFLMPVFLGKKAGHAAPEWYEALMYPALNFAFIIFPGSVMYLLFLLGLTTPSLVIQFLIGGGVSIGFFTLLHGGKLGVSRGKAITAFILTSLCGSAAYLVLAVGFAFFVNAI